MEKKKDSLILILILIIIGIIVSLIFVVLNNKNKEEESIKSSNNETLKVDTSKAYVYDATYSYDNKYTEYDRAISSGENGIIDYYGLDVEYTNGKQTISNLKVPYFNINSDDASKANDELSSLYNEYAKNFDTCAEESKDDKLPGCTLLLAYKSYQYDNIASVVVIDSSQATSTWVLNYHIYNFDLSTGKNLSYDEVLSKVGYNKDSISANLSDLIKNEMDSIMKDTDLTTACSASLDKYNTSNCYDITSKLLENSISDNSVLYFINDNGELNLLPILYFDYAQNGTVNRYLVTVSK
jgi:competence protein ComGC